MENYRIIDAVCNFHMWEPDDPDIALQLPQWFQDFMSDKIGQDPDIVAGHVTPQSFIDMMDKAGVERTFLVAVKVGEKGHPISRRVPYEKVAEVTRKYPDRFSGLAGIDPTEGMKGVAELEYAVKEMGFIGAHLFPHWFGMAPDHAKYYPFYAKCVELDIPIQMQVGHCLRYSPDRPLRSVGRPITLDTVACDFPDLKLVGIHTGWPWVDEMISVAYKHPNVYVGSDAFAPKYWTKEFVHFIDSFGSDKVIFGTDFPVIHPERALREIRELNIRENSLRKLLGENTIKLYNLT